jgi:hypothetical protein
MTYTVEGTTYSLSYRELKAHYENAIDMPDSGFISCIGPLIHLACIICYLKEIPADSQCDGGMHVDNGGWIYSQKIDDSSSPHSSGNYSMINGFTEITIEQFREITNPAKSNTMTPITKTEFIEWVRRNVSYGILYEAIINKAKQLPEDGEITGEKGEPELLPFEWPVPDGMEVVTRDGRDVTQLVKFECSTIFPFWGVLDNEVDSWQIDGGTEYDEESTNDLFLRPAPPEMVTLWMLLYPNGNGSFFKTEKQADEFSNILQCGTQKFSATVPKPSGKGI